MFMSNQGSNDGADEFLQKFEGWIKIGTATIAFLTGLIAFINLAKNDTGLVTKICLSFFIVILWLFCAYIYWKSTLSDRTVGLVTSVSPRNLRLRRLALYGMICIPILTAIGGYTWFHLPPKNIIVLVADFKNSDSKQDDYQVTSNIVDKLNDTTKNKKYSDVKVQHLKKVLQESKEARNEGKKQKAAIVIWGRYAATSTSVQIIPRFEILRISDDLPDVEGLERIADVSELKSFKLQVRLSNEIAYLSLFTVGLTRYTAHDWNKAIDSFNDALQQVKEPTKNLDKSVIYFFRGNSYYYSKKYDLAIADFNQALKPDPKIALPYNNRGLVYYFLKKYDLAIADFNQALKLDPKIALAYSNRGFVYYNLKKYELAIADFNQALKIDPESAELYSSRGFFYYLLEKYDLAIADYTQALKLDPKSANTYSKRGLVYENLEKYDLAIADYTQALKLYPKSADIYSTRGLVYRRLKKYDLAIADYTQALKLDPKSANTYSKRGNAYRKLKKYDSAIADVNQAFKLDPKSPLAYSVRGYIYYDLKKYDSAITDINQALKLDPKFTFAYYIRGLVYKNKGDKGKAIEDFNKVLQLNNDVELKQEAKEQLEKTMS